MKKNSFISVMHPFLFVVYVVLFLYSQNIEELLISDTFRVMAILIFFSASLFLLINIKLKNIYKSSLLTTLFMLCLLSYGHFFNYFGEMIKKLTETDPDNLVMLLSFMIFVFFLLMIIIFSVFIGAFKIIKTNKDLTRINAVFNYFITILLTIVIVHISTYSLKQFSFNGKLNIFDNELSDYSPEIEKSKMPDIYYFVLDEYGREDILKDIYKFDNSVFLKQLEDAGFYVAGKSRSNYDFTEVSISSSMNFSYIEDVESKYGLNRNSILRLLSKRKSRVDKVLTRFGYKTVAFLTGSTATNIKKADIFIKISGTNEFENTFIDSTPWPSIIWYLRKYFNVVDFRHVFARKRVLNVFEKVPEVVSISGPKIVFIHILSPHMPYVFDENGGYGIDITSKQRFRLIEKDKVHDRFISGYIDQVKFINKQLITAVKYIIQKSENEPVILLQGDHGPRTSMLKIEKEYRKKYKITSRYTTEILNAYYLPDGGDDLLYESISPVNTFRVIFNKYLGTNYKLLQDRTIYSPSLE